MGKRIQKLNPELAKEMVSAILTALPTECTNVDVQEIDSLGETVCYLITGKHPDPKKVRACSKAVSFHGSFDGLKNGFKIWVWIKN